MKRREFIVLLGGSIAIAAPRLTIAQTPKICRLGTLIASVPIGSTGGLGEVLVNTLAQRGYTLGENLIYEARGAEGKPRVLPQLMQELKAANVDVVVTVSYPAAVAAKASGVPTVLAYGAGDPVASGLVDSLARPGGNVTGICEVEATLSTKRLGLLKEMSPQLRRVAMLWNESDLGMSLRYETSAKAAQENGITVQSLGVREPDDFNDAFAAMNREPPDAILMVSDSLTLLNRKRVFEFAAERRLPAIYETANIAHDGGLMSYGADTRESFVRAAALVDRIFKGANPADLPIEQPTRYLFVLNLKTAKAMNLAVPNTLLSLADEVIE
jgi:putative tryptophan/tyrosine transport system substrate-binding protein